MSNTLNPGLMPATMNGLQGVINSASSSELGTLQGSVSGISITDTQALSGTGGTTIGETRVISSGPNAGTRVRWFQPASFLAPTWCWDIYPQSQYQG